MNPSWATEEYPAIRRASVWVNATAEPYRIETSAMISISVWKWAAAWGNSGSTIARNPYAPTFESTPLKTISTSIGIARYPSGIQPCSGNAGIFTRKAAAKNRKIHSCEPLLNGTACSAESTNVMCPPPCWAAKHAGGDRRGEHQQRADERVDDELDRGFHALLAGARGGPTIPVMK